MTPPLVSIITPAFNSSAFIGETIAAALAQTCADFELLVIDDGSSDDTIDVVHRAAGGDSRVIVMASAHGGPAAARNAGLDAARGRFIALLDSDDVWMPAYLESQLTLLGRFPDRAIVTANAINRGGRLDGRPLWPETSGWRALAPRDVIVQDDAVCIMSVFRREVADRIGGFDVRYTGNEDYQFWLRAVNAGFGIVQNRRPMGFYRRRPDSVSANETRMLSGIIRVLDAAGRMDGLMARERPAIARQLQRVRQEVVRTEMRASLARNDAATAALGLKTLSELRDSWPLAVAARVTMIWPHLLQRAYGLRRSLRTS
jgi:teichuronic acid biosynthesis glycosyltransferase TuaG